MSYIEREVILKVLENSMEYSIKELEEGERIARERAEEDIDYNNAEWGGTTVYCAWLNEESEGANEG